MMEITQKAVFAAGCFWGVEETFRKLPGVVSTRVGYTGGKTENPVYKEVCTDQTGHAEAVEIIYNPEIISYEKLLKIFFENHNPTTPNRQGPDIGTQYRSAIFYLDENQKLAAEKAKEELEKSGKYNKPVVTEITSYEKFYEAEEYHQKYLMKKGLDNCDWKAKLTPEQYKVLREKGTEPPFTGKYVHTKEDGTYVCAACGNELFSSKNKFDSECGWPSFDDAISSGNIIIQPDYSHGMVREEVVCAHCGSHLGHVFDDGPRETTGKRYCINSISLDLRKE